MFPFTRQIKCENNRANVAILKPGRNMAERQEPPTMLFTPGMWPISTQRMIFS